MNAGGGDPDLTQSLRPVPTFERAVREVSRMLSAAGIRHALVGGLGANAYRSRPRTTEDIDFLVGDEAFETHSGGFVTLRVPVIEFEGIAIDQVPLTNSAPAIEDGLNRAHVSRGVPIAPIETIVLMKLIAGRTQDFADIEAMIESGADRERLKLAVEAALPNRLATLERLFENVDRSN